MDGNAQLAALMREAGFLKDDGSVGLKVFARAVGQHANRTFTHTYVRRWLDGMVPRDAATRQAIVRALGSRLGRSIAVDEVGFGAALKVSPDLGLTYPNESADNVKTVARLWQGDLDSVSALLNAPANAAAWNEAALSWLVSTRQDVFSDTGKRKVNQADVDGIRSTTEMFDQLDGEHGGGHARRALIEFLRTDLAGLLGGTARDAAVQRDLFKAGAQATLLGAWMSYDAGIHGMAQRYFIQALRIAESTGDRLLGASILDAMSHQATFLGRYREAANLARSARMGTANAGSASAAAHFYAMEARALARLGDAAECDRAMSAAVREFERRDPANDPADWFGYFNESELAV
ncbi:XRE family transcriptional regulator [Amycolatopsis sp. NPDC049253]|uniref:XRE family transcriptional regulator n=1 Tax=Amycolatopsis sp. NPDC049253 TaxID=3155274 RepID=UPI00342575D0